MKRIIIILLMSFAIVLFFCSCKPEKKEDGIMINGVKWATRNVASHGKFVEKPEDFGGYYQWGRKGDGHEQPTSGTTTTLSITDDPGHGNFILSPSSPYDWRTPQNDNLWGTIKTANDPCPAGWRVPTQTEQALLTGANSYWGELNGVNGYFIGDGEPKLFLPAAGNRYGSNGSLGDVGTYGYYWSSTPNGTNAYHLYFYSGSFRMSTNYRAYGYTVRCVSEN